MRLLNRALIRYPAVWIGILSLTSARCADGTKDGIYEATYDTKAQQIIDVEGKRWRIGSQL